MSRVVDILKSIQNGETYNKDALSRAEEILKAICNNTSITMTARSRYETLLLCLKNKTTTDLTPRTRLEEILVAIINGTINTWITGKNLLNIYDRRNYALLGVYADVDNNSIFVEKKDTEFSISVRRCVIKFNCVKNTNYIFTGKLKLNNVINNQTGFLIRTGSTYGETIATVILNETIDEQSVNFTFNSGDYDVLYLWLYMATGATDEYQSATYSDIKIEKGSTATPYSPYCFLSELEEEYYKTFGV